MGLLDGIFNGINNFLDYINDENNFLGYGDDNNHPPLGEFLEDVDCYIGDADEAWDLLCELKETLSKEDFLKDGHCNFPNRPENIDDPYSDDFDPEAYDKYKELLDYITIIDGNDCLRFKYKNKIYSENFLFYVNFEQEDGLGVLFCPEIEIKGCNDVVGQDFCIVLYDYDCEEDKLTNRVSMFRRRRFMPKNKIGKEDFSLTGFISKIKEELSYEHEGDLSDFEEVVNGTMERIYNEKFAPYYAGNEKSAEFLFSLFGTYFKDFANNLDNFFGGRYKISYNYDDDYGRFEIKYPNGKEIVFIYISGEERLVFSFGNEEDYNIVFVFAKDEDEKEDGDDDDEDEEEDEENGYDEDDETAMQLTMCAHDEAITGKAPVQFIKILNGVSSLAECLEKLEETPVELEPPEIPDDFLEITMNFFHSVYEYLKGVAQNLQAAEDTNDDTEDMEDEEYEEDED